MGSQFIWFVLMFGIYNELLECDPKFLAVLIFSVKPLFHFEHALY